MIAPFAELFAEYAAEETVGLLRSRPGATATFLESAAAKAYDAALVAGTGIATYYGVKEIEKYEADHAKKAFTKRKREGDDDPDMTQPVKFDPPIDPSVNDQNDDFYEHGSVLNQGNHF